MLIAIVVVTEIVVTQQAEPPTLYLAAEPRRKWLSVYSVHREGNPPGLHINRANICSSSNNMSATLKLKFPNLQSMPRS